MKENHSSQNAQESGTSSFTRLRSKLSFERMVEMGAKMGMENPLFLCHERAAKATTVINGKEYINFSTYDYLDLNTHPEITEAVTEAAKQLRRRQPPGGRRTSAPSPARARPGRLLRCRGLHRLCERPRHQRLHPGFPFRSPRRHLL